MLAWLACASPAPAIEAGAATVTGAATDRERAVIEAMPLRAKALGGGRGGAARAATAAMLGSLPVTFSGTLPCGDCAGIRQQIDFLPGGAYMQRVTHLRDRQDVSTYEIGRCRVSADGRTLTLEADRTRARWFIADYETMNRLDDGGRGPAELKRTESPEPMTPRVRLRGMFRHLADAPRFCDCVSGLEWPVAVRDGYKALERAYVSRRSEPGAELLVSLNGRIESLPRRQGRGTEPTLVVERFLGVHPGQACEEGAMNADLERIRWRPLAIGELAVTVSASRRAPWIQLDPRTKRMSGSGGCNQIGGAYQAGDGRLRFGPIIATQMACADMEIETAFLRALSRTRGYRIQGRTLELMDEKQLVVARLEEIEALGIPR